MVEEAKKEIAVIGSRGLLGKAFFTEASKYFDTVGLAHSDLDITDRRKTLEVIRSLKPKIIVLTAAYTDVDGCEENPQLAFRVNVEGAKNAAHAAKQEDATLIYISTDCVFNGQNNIPYREEDKVDPISVYGRTKLEGERAVQAELEKYVIIRTVWLYGDADKGFVQAVLKAIEQKTSLKVVTDKTGALTSVVDLSMAICEIARRILDGQYDFTKGKILHITNGGVCTWLEIAQFIIKELNVDCEMITTTLAEFPFKAQRPKYSALDNTKFEQIFGQGLRPWQESLKEFIRLR